MRLEPTTPCRCLVLSKTRFQGDSSIASVELTMGSYIQIDSISIDLVDSIGNTSSTQAGNCEHFSIRDYVSEIRKKDWKMCWPFPLNESEENPSLPPPDVPNYRCLSCQDGEQENPAEEVEKDDQIDFNSCSTRCKSHTNCEAALKSGIQQEQDLTPDTLPRGEIDLNTNLNCLNDCLPISNEREKQPGVVISKIIDLESGLVDNLNRPGLIQEVHTTKRGFEGGVELTSNVKCMDKSSAEICNGSSSSGGNECQKELSEASKILREGTSIMGAAHHTDGYPPESVACNHSVPTGSVENIVENDFPDHQEKSTALTRRRPRKVRLMSDLLSGELKTEQTAIQGSPSNGPSNASAASQAPLIFPVKVDIQGDLTLTNMGQNRKRKLLPDEVRRPAGTCDQRVETKVQNPEGGAKTIDAVPESGCSSIVLEGIGSQDATKAYRSKPEIERSHNMRKKKTKRIQVVDNTSIPEQHRKKQREDDYPMDTADKAYAPKTLSSTTLSSDPSTGKGMDNFPLSSYTLSSAPFSLSKGKGKMLQTGGELDLLSCRKNDMLVEDSFAYSGGKIIPNMPMVVPDPVPLHHNRQISQGPEEGLHLSLNSYLAAQVYNKKCIHQIENRLPFSLPFQEGTSKIHKLTTKDSETNVFGGPSIPSKHITNAVSGKGVHCEEVTGARMKEKTAEGVEQLGIVKRCSEQTAEESEPGTLDDIPMEIVELLAKNQYERCLPDIENKNSTLEKSTVRKKVQMAAGSTVYGKKGARLLKEGQKQKPHGRPKKNNMVTRENVKPSKRKPDHYFSAFDGNNLGVKNPFPPQSPFEFEVSQSQKKPPSRFQFSPIGSSQLGSARNCKFNASLEEHGSSNATLQAQGGCSLHKTILRQDGEASRIWASLAPNHVSQGYEVPKKVVSHPTSSNMDMTSLRSGSLHKQNMKRDADLNYINLNAAGIEKLNRNTSPGTFSRVNGQYAYPCKHNGVEYNQNLRGSLDLYSNETIPAMHLLSLMDAGMQSGTPFNAGVSAQMLKRPPYPGDCNTKLEIGTSKAHGTQKRQSSDYFRKSYLSDKPHGCFVGSPAFGASFNGQSSTKSGKKDKMKSPNSTLQNRVSKQFSWSNIEAETPLQRKLNVCGTQEASVPLQIISGSSCMVNKNPADFAMPETGNVYMISGEDLKFDKSISKYKPRFTSSHGCKQQRIIKGTKSKEHSKH